MIVLLARRLRDSGPAQQPPQARTGLRSTRRFWIVLAITAAACVGVAVLGLLAGSLWLRLGDVVLWAQGGAPDLVARALGERLPRMSAAVLAGAALALAGCVVQSTVRNPLAEPGLLGITAGAGFGAAVVVTSLGGARALMVLVAVLAGVGTFALISVLAWRGGLMSERFVLIGIGVGYGLSALTTFVLLRSNPYDTPRILGVRLERARFGVLGLAAALAAISVVAVGVVGFVGLVAPHLARALVGGRHLRAIPVAMLLGGILVGLADALGRTVIAPAQVPAGLLVAIIGAPYFVWLLWRSRA